MKIDCTKYTETKTAKRADRTLNYRPMNSEQANEMAEQFRAFLGNGWEVHVAGRNPHGHGWGSMEFTVYAVKFL
jgi:hypothetical protein